MGTVYILKLKDGKYYVGSTNNIERRIREHKTGQVRSTKNKRPLFLIFSKEYSTIKEARRMEYRIKRQKSKEIIELYIEGKIRKTNKTDG